MDLFQDITIISWNIRGALGRSTCRHVRDIISLHHPTFFFIYETHGAFNKVQKFWHDLGYNLIFVQEARGHSGGIWILTNRDDLTFNLIDSSFQAITFSISKGNASWYVSAVYASPIFSVRCALWQQITALRRIINGPWLLVGDLNEVLSSSEVLGGSFSPSRAFILSTMMDDCSFIDMDTVGGLFTWRKNVQNGGHTRKRLDRCMADVAWRMHFPDALVELLPPHNSDHNPLLVSCSKSPSKRVKSFHFQASWISHPDYGSLVRSTWNNTPGDVTFKLHKIMEESQTFNTEVFGNIFHNK